LRLDLGDGRLDDHCRDAILAERIPELLVNTLLVGQIVKLLDYLFAALALGGDGVQPLLRRAELTLRLPGLVAQVLQTPLPRAEFLLLKGDDLTLLADFIEHRAQFVQPAGLRLGALLKLLDPRLRLRELLEGQVKV